MVAASVSDTFHWTTTWSPQGSRLHFIAQQRGPPQASRIHFGVQQRLVAVRMKSIMHSAATVHYEEVQDLRAHPIVQQHGWCTTIACVGSMAVVSTYRLL